MIRSKWFHLFLWTGLCLCGPGFLLAGEDGKENNRSAFKKLSTTERSKLFQQEWDALAKSLSQDDRHDDLKETIINGNQIRVLITNQGSISTPTSDNANADLVWPNGPSGLGYAFEFGPLVGAEVVDANGDTVQIISDGFFASSGGEFEPGTSNRWGWEPKLGFSDPASNELAHFSDLDTDFDGKPDSWPENWWNPTLGRYVWPAFLGDDATTPDEEVFYVMDDFDNAEFDYFPFPSDPSIRGIGLELQVRIFQFNNPLAEDIVFLVYTITNVSPTPLDKVFLGMFGDPHVGGPNDFSDDNADFVSPFNEDFDLEVRNMLFAFDADGIGDQGKVPGYFGYRFLESPGLEEDGFDNDDDDLVDESPFNEAGTFEFRDDFGKYRGPGFAWTGDEDGDWLAEFDDVGVDGIGGTGDFGEGDGKPNQLFYLDFNNNAILDSGEPTSESREPGMRFFGGEPNFGFLDIAESDQLGLTSFNAILFGGNNEPRNDPLMWDLISTPNQREDDEPPNIEQEADNVFIYGSGPFALDPGESVRFSIALLMGDDITDLLSNAQTSQQVFEADYRFAQAPRKPNLVAVPGDERVTLYWDTGAEDSFDPFIARANIDDPSKGFDFEGYRIYRSEDFSFNDTKVITDSRGIPFLSTPLEQINGLPAQFDLINEFEGLSDIEYAGRGVRFDLGRNNGLVHAYTDSNNVTNGVTYFYAVTSYDHGDANAQISPTESQRTIQRDAVTREFSFDINTAMVVPAPPGSGYQEPSLEVGDGDLALQEIGDATGSVRVEFIDPELVQEDKIYDVTFQQVEGDSGLVMSYNVIDQEIYSSEFVIQDTVFVSMNACCPLLDGSVTVFDASGGTVDPATYELDLIGGRIRGSSPGSLGSGELFSAEFQVTPVANSLSINSEDDNPVFDGIRLFVQDQEVGLDSLSTVGGRSGFKTIVTGTNFSDANTVIADAGAGTPAPIDEDFEIRFVDYDTTANGDLINPADSTVAALGGVRANFQVIRLKTGEPIDFFISEPNASENKRWDWQETIVLLHPEWQSDETTYEVTFSPPSDTIVFGPDSIEIVQQDPIYPGDGDVFLIFATKPFEEGDMYRFKTKAVSFSQADGEALLDDIIVVPNPYVAFSASEIAGVRTGDRDERRIEFRNLPPKCTIRIYTITGERVDTIKKDDSGSIATWDLLTFESQQIAYGVYIYHVEAPGIGNKIGRFGVIK